MSFKIRDTSVQYQQPDPVPQIKESKSKSKKEEKETEEKETEEKTISDIQTVIKRSSEGFQVKHNLTNQCDYF